MKYLLRLLCALMICFAALFCIGVGGLWLFFKLTQRVTISEYDLGRGIELELFVRNDWEVGDVLFYRAEKDGQELVYTTNLGLHDRNDPLEITTFPTIDDSLVGFHIKQADDESHIGFHTKQYRTGNCSMFIMIDLESGESWPRLRDGESLLDPAVEAKWARRYSRLKERNPDLPCAGSFEAPNKSLEATATSAEPQL